MDDSYSTGVAGLKVFDVAVKQIAGVDDTLYVGSGVGVLVLDAQTMERDDTIPLAGVSSSYKMYVATVGDDSIIATRYFDDTVSIINPRSDDSINVSVDNPLGIAISPDNEWAYVASQSWRLYKIRTATGQIDSALSLPGPAQDVAVASDGTIFVTVQGASNTVRVYDQGSLAQAILVSIPSPYGVAVSPTSGQAFVSSWDGTNSSLKVLATFAPTPPTPAGPFPPGAPTDVVATNGWQKVTVDWKAPGDVGSYPITNYLVRATPGGRLCVSGLADAKLTQCTFDELTLGINYTFTVQALNGGGWGAQSAASNSASPYDLRATSQGRRKITLFGIPLGSEVRASGAAYGYPAQTPIGVWIKEGNGGQWVQQLGSRLASDFSGRFTWGRKFSAFRDTSPMWVKFSVGNDFSNEILFPPVR